jgi:hypothetical protein
MYWKRLIISTVVVYAASALILIKGCRLRDIVLIPWSLLAAVADIYLHPAVCVAATLAILALSAKHRMASILAVAWFVVNALFALLFLFIADPYKTAVDDEKGRPQPTQEQNRPPPVS